jgi:hypothetical protein
MLENIFHLSGNTSAAANVLLRVHWLYTLACRIFKISQFNIHKQSNITYFSIIFNTLHNYNYQDERTQGEWTRIHALPSVTFSLWNNLLVLDSSLDRRTDRIKRNSSNKTRCRQWFDRYITSKMILKSGSNWLFPVVFSVEITLSGSHSGNSFEFSHRLTDFLNYALFCLSLNLKPVNYFTTKRSSMAKRESGSIRPNSLFALGPFVLIIIIM